MEVKSKPVFRRFHAIGIAIITMWVLQKLGVFLLFHFGVDRDFCFAVGWGGGATSDIIAVGGFYFFLFIAQSIGASVGGHIIASSTFERPLIVAFIVSFCYHSVFGGINFFSWAWFSIPGLNQTIPIWSEILMVCLLSCVSVWGAADLIGKFIRKKFHKTLTNSC